MATAMKSVINLFNANINRNVTKGSMVADDINKDSDIAVIEKIL